MEAKPLVASVERRQQRGGAREVDGRPRGAGAPEDRVAEIAAEAIEDRGPPHDLQPALGDRGEEFLLDVVDDDSVVAGKPGDRSVEVRLLGEGEAGEVE